jgi:alpha-ribazole phosphatase
MKLYLIRHPKPNDAEGLCYGRLDVAIDSALLAATLAKVRQSIPAAVLQRAPIFTSPLSRCAQFANAIAEPRTAEVAEELIELDFGSWEGKTWNTAPGAVKMPRLSPIVGSDGATGSHCQTTMR